MHFVRVEYASLWKRGAHEQQAVVLQLVVLQLIPPVNIHKPRLNYWQAGRGAGMQHRYGTVAYYRVCYDTAVKDCRGSTALGSAALLAEAYHGRSQD